MEQLGKLHQATRSLELRAPCLEMDRAKGLNQAQETQALVSFATSKLCVLRQTPLHSLGSGSSSQRPLPAPKF